MKGVAGYEDKQDYRVSVKLKKRGKLNIKLNSKMDKMFGKQIIEAAEQELDYLGVKNADVVIDDFSSRDFVIQARIRTAVRRARGEQDV